MKENEADRKLVEGILKEIGWFNLTETHSELATEITETVREIIINAIKKTIPKVRDKTEKKILDEMSNQLTIQEDLDFMVNWFDNNFLVQELKEYDILDRWNNIVNFIVKIEELRKRHGL